MLPQGSEWILHEGRHTYDGYFKLKEQASAVTTLVPQADYLHLYSKDDGAGVSALFYRDDADVEHNLSGGLTGTGTANRLAYWTGSTTLDDLAALTQHRLLVADANGLPTNGNALTAGSVLFGGTNGIPEDDNANFFWDDALNRLGIGTATPTAPIQILRTATTDGALIISAASSVGLSLRIDNSVGTAQFFLAGATDDFMPGSVAGDCGYRSGTDDSILFGDAGNIRLKIDSADDISHASSGRHRMLSQNRFRYLNMIVSVRKSADQDSLTVNAWNTITYDTEYIDTDTIHSTVSNTSRLTAPIAGKYLAVAIMDVKHDSAVGSTVVGSRIIANGVTTVAYGIGFTPTAAAAGGGIVTATGVISLAAAEYIEAQAFCDGVGSFGVRAGTTQTTRFSLFYIGE